jgi:hypothetical protein
MKLSAAIRIGSMTTKQITGVMHDGGNGRCAMGAAGDAAGLKIYGNIYYALDLAFPILMRHFIVPNPTWAQNLGGMITYLNDRCGWTREQIADWVETIEAQEEAKSEQRQLPELSAATEKKEYSTVS